MIATLAYLSTAFQCTGNLKETHFLDIVVHYAGWFKQLYQSQPIIQKKFTVQKTATWRKYIDWTSSSMKHYVCLCTKHTWPLILQHPPFQQKKLHTAQPKDLDPNISKEVTWEKGTGTCIADWRDFIVHSCSFYRFVWKSKPCWFHNRQWSVSHIRTFMRVERFIFSIAFQGIKGRYWSSVETPLQHISFFPYFKQRNIS